MFHLMKGFGPELGNDLSQETPLLVLELHLCQEFGWTLPQVRALSFRDWHAALDYRSAKRKVAETTLKK